MTEKKSRLLLLVFSIAISTMMLITSVGVLEVILNSYSSAYTIGNEGASIVINSKEKSFFSLDDVNSAGIEEYFGEIDYTGIMSHKNDEKEMIYVNLRGKELEQVKSLYSDIIIQGNIASLSGKACLISQRTSEVHSLSVGDTLQVKVSGEDTELQIVGISANTGVFYMDTSSRYSIIVNYDFMEDYFYEEDKYNVVFAKSTEKTINESIDLFRNAKGNENYDVNRLYDDEALSEEYSAFFISMYAMLGFVIIMCFVIIYGAFSLVLNERMSTIGTFLSQGATRARVKSLLLIEGICYGILGGVLGDCLGILILYFINQKISPLAQYGIAEKFNINPVYTLGGLIFAVIISFLACILPISKINRLPVKEVILNNFYVPVKNGWGAFFIGFIMIVVAVVGVISNEKWTNDLSFLLTAFAVLGIVLITSKVIDLVTKFICNVVKGKFSITFLALNNIRTSRVLMVDIILIVITLFSSISINAVSRSMIDTINAAYYDMEYDIAVNNILPNRGEQSTTELIIEDLTKQDYVETDSINPFYKEPGYLENINTYILGVYPEKFRNYMTYLDLNSDQNKEMFDKFSKQQTPLIVVTDKLLDKLSKEIGDEVTVKINDIEYTFNIVGSFDGGMYFSGMLAMIPFDYMTDTYGLSETSTITMLVNEKDEEAKVKINTLIFDYGAISVTKAEESATKISVTNTLCESLMIFSQLIIIIAVFGIINNMLVGLFQRKKELALLSSIGMSNRKRNLMLLLESLLTVFWSIIIIVPYSYFSVKVISKFMKWTGMPVVVQIDFNNVLLTVLITVAGVILATIPVFLKSKKISIIDELRYE